MRIALSTQRRAVGLAASAARRDLSSSTAPVVLELTDLSDPSNAHTKAPVVFIHGLLGSGTNFRSIALHPSIRTNRQIITLDLRNHGKSPHSAGRISLEAMAHDVIETLEKTLEKQQHKCNLIGHSLGGKVSSLVALKAPHLLSQLVVMDIAPVNYSTRDEQWSAVTNVVEAANAIDPSKFKTRGEIDKALAARVPDAGMRSFVAQNLLLLPDGTYRWRINLPNLLASMPSFATFPQPPPSGPYGPAAGLPAQFIGGERSRYILPEHHDAIRAFFPRARFHTVKDAGHWIHADQPAAFISLLASLLL